MYAAADFGASAIACRKALSASRCTRGLDVYAPCCVTRSSWQDPAAAGLAALGLATAGGVVYLGTETGSVYAISASLGSVLWHASTGSFVDASPVLACFADVREFAIEELRQYVARADEEVTET